MAQDFSTLLFCSDPLFEWVMVTLFDISCWYLSLQHLELIDSNSNLSLMILKICWGISINFSAFSKIHKISFLLHCLHYLFRDWWWLSFSEVKLQANLTFLVKHLPNFSWSFHFYKLSIGVWRSPINVSKYILLLRIVLVSWFIIFTEWLLVSCSFALISWFNLSLEHLHHNAWNIFTRHLFQMVWILKLFLKMWIRCILASHLST